MLLTLLACQSGNMIDHPDDEIKDFVYDAETDPLLPDNYQTTCDDGDIEESRENVFGERLCLAFTEASQYVGLTDTSDHIGAYSFDYNGDKYADIFISNDDADSNLYSLKFGAYNDDAAKLGFKYHFEDEALAVGLNDYHPNDVTAFDFDKDNDVDLAMTGDNGSFVLENSAGIFVAIEAPFSSLTGQSGKSVRTLGSDIIFATDSGISYFSYNGTTFEDATSSKGIDDQDRMGALAVCDIDNDGDDDIFAAKEVGDTDSLFINGGSSFSSILIDTVGDFPATQTSCTTLFDDNELALSTARYGSDSVLYCDVDYNCEYLADDYGLASSNDTTAAIYEDFTKEGVTSVFKTNNNGKNELLIPVVDDSGDYSYYSDFAVSTGTDFEGQSSAASSLDFDRDGIMDIVTVEKGGSIFSYANKSRFLE